MVSFSLGQELSKPTQFGNLSHHSPVVNPRIMQESTFRFPLHNNLHVFVSGVECEPG